MIAPSSTDPGPRPKFQVQHQRLLSARTREARWRSRSGLRLLKVRVPARLPAWLNKGLHAVAQCWFSCSAGCCCRRVATKDVLSVPGEVACCVGPEGAAPLAVQPVEVLREGRSGPSRRRDDHEACGGDGDAAVLEEAVASELAGEHGDVGEVSSLGVVAQGAALDVRRDEELHGELAPAQFALRAVTSSDQQPAQQALLLADLDLGVAVEDGEVRAGCCRLVGCLPQFYGCRADQDGCAREGGETAPMKELRCPSSAGAMRTRP